MTAPLCDRPTAFGALSAVYTGQLSRARAARGPLLFVATLQSVGILLLLRGVVDPGGSTARQVVAGATVLVVAFVALNLLAQRFGQLRSSNALDHYVALPVPAWSVVLGTTASYATFTVPGALVTGIVGAVLYGLPVLHLWVLVAVLPLAGAVLAGAGAALGLLPRRPELATTAGQLGMTAVLFLAILPAGRLPGWLVPARALIPGTFAADALAAALAPNPSWGQVAGRLAACAGFAVLTLSLATWAFRRAVRS